MQGTLDPQSEIAAEIATLWWAMLGAGVLILLGVLVALALSVRSSRRTKATLSPGAARALVIGGGIVTPALAIVAMLGAGLVLTGGMIATPTGGITVEITGRQWWWRIRYLDEAGETLAVTANELHVPVGETIGLRLVSEDVIHSFWVPSLQGKTDLVPGHENRSWIRAETAGTYRGQCAEFCGLQHAMMGFTVVAQSPDAFDAWLQDQAADLRTPDTGPAAAGREVFLGVGCGGCHTIRGTAAAGTFGPDLTHLASRRHLAAATLANTRQGLRRWITAPQDVKPGSKMPATEFEDGDLDRLLDFLESLT